MSRPSSYHDPAHYSPDPIDIDGFALPLFNAHQPSISHHPQYAATSPAAAAAASPAAPHEPPSLPPPLNGLSAQQRQSLHLPLPRVSPTGPPPPAGTAVGVAAASPGARVMSHLPYAAQYPHSAHPSGPGRQDLMPPPASSSGGGGLGSLARSASLGTRKKDPYSYASDDVESGLGMDAIIPQQSPSGAAWAYRGRQPQPQQVYAPQPPQQRDVVMSPSKPSPHSGNGYAMNPPPVPPHALSRPPMRHDSNGSSPSRPSSLSQQATNSSTNPYLPRGSDPGPSSAQTQWADYRPPDQTQRIPSAGSYNSPMSDPLSPYSRPNEFSSPHSPMTNPYDLSPSMSTPLNDPTSATTAIGAGMLPNHPVINIPPSPQMGSSSIPWPASPYAPSSPSSSTRPAQAYRSHSHQQQLYPASQPVTPASSRQCDMGPPRNMPSRESGSRSRSAPSRKGFRVVAELGDLMPIVNPHPSGRRADPDKPGKYLSPLKCLTVALPQTYALCNSSFRYESSDNPRRVLTKPSKPMYNDGADNEDCDYILYVNDVLGGENGGDRYLILDVLGQGTFGQVVKCQNMRTHDICAVKVVKNKPAYLNQSKMEVAILDMLNNQWDRDDRRHILRMYESFTHKNHLCLVFECLSSNLYELIKQNSFKGLSTSLVKVFTSQLLDCLSVLKEARLIHCDLKPENILLKSLQSPHIKVIDFGSACHEMQTIYTYIQSRFYRSPEVLLGLPYSTSIDMWSLGCIVVELFLGLPLFPGTSEYNQVSRIVDMLGLPPVHLLEVGKQTHEFFNLVGVDAHDRKQYALKSMRQYSTEHNTDEQPSKQYFQHTKLRDIIMEYPISKKNAKQSDIDKEMSIRRAFVDFVGGLLELDPIKRWSPKQAMGHPFITGEKFTGPYQPTVPSAPSRKTPHAPAPSAEPTTPSGKKYGGLVQNTTPVRSQRIYSDAAAYGQQLAQHQAFTAQQQAQQAQQAASRQPYYEPRHPAQHNRVSSQQYPQQWPQPHVSSSSSTYHPRIPSQGLTTSVSHQGLRVPSHQNTMISPGSSGTNPPPNSYYPSSRNRANTINQMDAIPPALARLTQYAPQDPSGTRNLTPVLNRDEGLREWERRQQGHAKRSSLAQTTYPQLEYLQEQAELAAMGGSSWMMPGQYSHSMSHHAPSHHQGQSLPTHSLPTSSHRATMSAGGSAAYHMQPPIAHVQTRPRAGEYDPQPSSSASGSNRSGRGGFGQEAYLPQYPPPAATTGGSQPNSATTVGSGGVFDAFGDRDPQGSLGMMYTPLQPMQPGYPYSPGSGSGGGHSARASYSGPYGTGHTNNPFAQQQQQQQQQQLSQASQQQQSQASPRSYRRSGNYPV